MGELVGAHPDEVEGQTGAVYTNETVEDADLGQADSVESNAGYNNGEQGE